MSTTDKRFCIRSTTDKRFNLTPRRICVTIETGRVSRYHAAPSVQPQTIAHHSWGVLMIALYITGGKASRNLMLECALHDTAEYFTGDSPYDAKLRAPKLKALLDTLEDEARHEQLLCDPIDLSPHDQAVLKMADTLEGFVWCVQTERGNLIRNRWNNSFNKARLKFKPVLSSEEYARAKDIFCGYGGTIHPPINHNLRATP